MKKQLALILSLFCALVMGQDEDRAARRLKYTSPADQAIYLHEDAADKLSSFEIFKELARLDAAQTANIAVSGFSFDVDP